MRTLTRRFYAVHSGYAYRLPATLAIGSTLDEHEGGGFTSIDLWSLLAADRVQQRELCYALQQHFQSSWTDVTDRAQYFARDPEAAATQADYALRLRYENDKVVSIDPGPQLTDADLCTLRQWIEEHVLRERGTRVARRLFFSSHPVLGAWRYRERLQIFPLMTEAPKTILATGSYPFVLEVPYPVSDDHVISLLRQESRFADAGLLLSLFLDGPVEPPPNPARYHWVSRVHDGQLITQHAPEGYLAAGFVSEQADFSGREAAPALPTAPPRDYFARWALAPGVPMDIPSSLESLFDAFFALDLPLQKQFLRACYWLRHASLVFSYSHSAAYLAVIQAIETVLPPAETDRCETCGMNRGKGLTARFREFLEEYAPGGQLTRKARGDLYRMRSKLAHGHALLQTDIDPMGGWGGPSPMAWQELGNAMEAQHVARVALINWLTNDRLPADMEIPRVVRTISARSQSQG